jgi:hypothetical protein
MLVLDATTKSITVAMTGAPATTNPDFVSTWADNTTSSFTQGSSDGALNGTSQVTLVAAPGSSTQRTVKSIYIENKDTAAVTIVVTYNNNSTLRTIASVTLQVGDTWTTDGTFDNSGALKSTVGVVNLANVTGTLGVDHGGTGATTLTGYVKGSGTSAMTASSTIPNTDITGLGTMSTQSASSVAITGGAIDGTTIGATSATTGKFTTVTATSGISGGTF